MTALEAIPTHQNMLSPVGFVFKAKRLPTTVFYSQKVSIPSINLQPITTSNPFVKVQWAGDHVEFGTFDVQFRIDEGMINYQEIFSWIITLGFPDAYEEYASIESKSKLSGEWLRCDASTIVFDAQNNPSISIDYKNVFPVALRADDFDARDTEINYMSATATFVTESYKFTSLRA